MTEPVPSRHPLLTQLADFLDGTLGDEHRVVFQAHLDACRACRVALRHAADGPRAVLPAATPDHRLALDPDLLKRLRGEPPDPSPGQLWRLRWDEAMALSVVLRVEGDDVVVVPVGLDPWMADDYAVVVGAEWSPLPTGFAAWVGLEAVVPLVVLDVFLGEIDALDQIAVVRQAYRRGTPVPETVVVGPPLTDADAERAQYRRQISLALASLAETTWFDVAVPEAGARSLVELLRDVDPRRLAEALGLDTRSAFALMGGERLVDDIEAEVIAALVGVDIGEVRTARPAVPAELIHELGHPRHRRAVERQAQAASRHEGVERRVALAALLPAAARRAGDESAPLDWRRLVDDHFEA